MKQLDYSQLTEERERKAIGSLCKIANVKPAYENIDVETEENYKPCIAVNVENGRVIGLRIWNCALPDLEPVRFLTALRNLDFTGNNIRDLSPIQELSCLETLKSGCNKISNLTPLAELVDLFYIDCSHNRIKSIRPLSSLKKLRQVCLRSNNISSLEGIQELTCLEIIDFQDNQISDLGPISKLIRLKLASFEKNRIHDLSPLSGLKKLENIFLSDNNIISLEVFSRMPAIKEIRCSGNPLQFPPIDVAVKGIHAIRNFFAEVVNSNGFKTFREGKVIILGDGDVGKTTLYNLLCNVKNPFDTKPTLGANLSSKGVPWRSQKHVDLELKANIWEFGGQEIQYNLHHCFLTPDAVYILVTDNRRGKTRWDYWFMLILAIIQRSRRSYKAPVLVVMNRKLNVETHFDFEITKFTNNHAFHGKMDVTHHEINLLEESTGNNWKALTDRIWDRLLSLPVVNVIVPNNWLQLRNELTLLAKNRRYILLSEFHELGLKSNAFKGITSMNTALDYFADIGLVLHYSGNLAPFVFLDLQWVMINLYKIIEKTDKNSGGRTSEDELRQMWQTDNECDIDSEVLLNLLTCPDFGICFRVGDSQDYIIPCLLPTCPVPFFGDTAGCLNMRIDYPIMPDDLIGRLIVRLSPWIENHQYVWCDGVAIVKDDAEAFITSTVSKETGGRCLRISIRENKGNADGMLWTIHGAIQAIHKQHYKEKILFMPYIACNCESCVTKIEPFYFAMSSLLTLMRNGVYETHCHHSAKLVDVGKLLGQVTRPNDKNKNVIYWFDKVDTFVGENHGDIRQLRQDRPPSVLPGKSEGKRS